MSNPSVSLVLLREVLLSPENIAFIEGAIQDELVKRSYGMWVALEQCWGRGCIEKPLIVPNNFDDLRQQMITALEDYPALYSERELNEVNRDLIEQQVQSFLSGAKQNFLYQKQLYRDHPIYSQRSKLLREKSLHTGAPLSINRQCCKLPPGSQKDYWAGFLAL